MLVNEDVMREMARARRDDFRRHMQNEDRLREAGSGGQVGRRVKMPIATAALTVIKSAIMVVLP